MSIKVNPTRERKNPEYGVAIEEIVAGMELGYTDTTAKTSTIFEVSEEPDWRQNPDFLARFLGPEYETNFPATDWTKKGPEFQDTGISIDAAGIDTLKAYVGYKAPESIRSIKFTNPWPWVNYCEVIALKADYSTLVLEALLGLIPPYGTLTIDIVDYLKAAALVGDLEYISAEQYWYHEDHANNVIVQNDSNDGFLLATPETDPKYNQPFFGAIGIDGYNILDKYGGLFAAGEGLLAMSTQFMAERNAFEALGATRGLAKSFGVGVPSAATMLGLQSYMGWADETKILDSLIPALGVGLSPIASNWALSQLPDKYFDTLNAATGMAAKGIVAGASVGATAYFMMRTMDDIAYHVEI